MYTCINHDKHGLFNAKWDTQKNWLKLGLFLLNTVSVQVKGFWTELLSLIALNLFYDKHQTVS